MAVRAEDDLASTQPSGQLAAPSTSPALPGHTPPPPQEAALAWLASASPTWQQRASHVAPLGPEGGKKSHEEPVNPWSPQFPAAGTRGAAHRAPGPPPAQTNLRCAEHRPSALGSAGSWPWPWGGL